MVAVMLDTKEVAAISYPDALKDYECNKAEAIAVVCSLRARRAGLSVSAQEIDARLFRRHTSLLQLLAVAGANGNSYR
jgi:hypothetical protein